MSKRWLLLGLAVSMIVAGARPARAANYAVGTCLPKLIQFSTIQAAVSSVPPGSTILVCPGTYFEQVTISQPLTLKGQVSGNADRPVIAAPATRGLAINVTTISGVQVAAQVAAQNVSPAGNVNITGITIDGAQAAVAGCSSSAFLVGIFYGLGTSGTISDNTTRFQQLPSCGYGIWVENGAAPNQSITIENNSVHDMTWTGIYAFSNQTPSTLTAKITGNFVNGQVFNQTTDINAAGVSGSITGNVVTGGLAGILTTGGGPLTISANGVADITIGVGIAIGDGSTVTSNKISNVYEAFLLGGSGVNPGPSITANIVQNTTTLIEYQCIRNVTVKSNTFNDSLNGYRDLPSTNNGLGTNTLNNVDTLISGITCP